MRITKALIFGSVGCVLLFIEDKLHILREEDEAPRPAMPLDNVGMLYETHSEMIEISGREIKLPWLKKALRRESQRHDTLYCAITGMDSRMSMEVRIESIKIAESSLKGRKTRKFFENRFLRVALPKEADIDGAIQLAAANGCEIIDQFYQKAKKYL